MKRFRFLIIIAGLVIFMMTSCKSNFLNYQPKGVINGSDLNTPQRVDQMVTAVLFVIR